MINVICDACKKSIPGPVRGINYRTLLDKELCLSCHDKLEEGIAAVMEQNREFHIKDFHSVQSNLLFRMTR